MTLRALHRKAVKRKQSRWKVQVVAAIAYTRKGNVLGTALSAPSNIPGIRQKHAEGILMGRFGRASHKIIIIRIDRAGNLLPIEPCSACKKLAERLGIIIEEVPNDYNSKRRTAENCSCVSEES